MSLDIYAKPYIPAWLLKVNEATEGVNHHRLPASLQKNPTDYIATFSGSDVWTHVSTRGSTSRSRRHENQDQFNARVEELLHLLRLESLALEKQAKGWNRYSVRLSPRSASFNRSKGVETPSSTQLYTCTVQGVAEFTPRVLLHDPIELRQLVPINQTFDAWVVHGRVVAVKRAFNQLIIECPTLSIHSGLFNLTFPHDDKTLAEQRSVLEQVVQEDNAWLASCLYPSLKDCRLKTQLTRVREFDWKDKQLNLEQMKAVQEIQEQKFGDLPYLIQGPPGTGKTKTVVEAILQIISLNSDAKIIACGPSNTAADTLAQRLAKHLDPVNLLRLNSSSRSFEEVPEPLLPYSSIKDDMFALPDFVTLMSKRVIVATTLELMQLKMLKCDNRSLAQLETYLTSSLYAATSLRTSKAHFTHLFLDEAGQATEPETLCAMSVVQPPEGQRVSVVLAGDHQQLGPRILSWSARQHGLDHSLLEMLLDRPCYADHPLSRKNIQSNPRPKLPFVFPAFANLYRNYRSHPKILMVPSQMFYNSSLACYAHDVNSFVNADRSSNPVEFVGHDSEEATADVNIITAWYNQAEVTIITQRIKVLIQSPVQNVRPEDIAVMAPYREQVVRIRLALRKENLAGVRVGTVEDYQGSEARIVIISIVRTMERFLEQDDLHGVGLLHERRRTNVAITRARELLIVVGNPTLMWKDDTWRIWLQFCMRSGTYYDPESLEDNSKMNRSRPSIEYGDQNTTDHDLSLGGGNGHVEQYSDEAMLLAGHAAQLLLDDSEY